MRRLAVKLSTACCVALMSQSVSAAADSIPGVPEYDADLKNVLTAAQYVSEKSLPACLSAACAKGDCVATQKANAELIKAEKFLAEMETPLLQVRKLYTDYAHARLVEANTSQDKIDELTRLQWWQDVLQTTAKAAAESASWTDFLTSAKEKFITSDNAHDVMRFAADVLKRIKSAIGIYPTAGQPKREKSTIDIAAKFVAEMTIELEGLEYKRRKYPENWSEKGGRAGLGKVLKKIGDFFVDLDRETRRARITQYGQDNSIYHANAHASLNNARRINDRIQLANKALIAVRKARFGAVACSYHFCNQPIAVPTGSEQEDDRGDASGRVNDPAERQRALERLNRGLQSTFSTLHKVLDDYVVQEDLQSQLALTKSDYTPRELVRADYRIAPICIPESAHYVVQEGNTETPLGGDTILDLGPRSGSRGKLAFRIFHMPPGVWQSQSGQQVTINIEGQDIRLVMPDTPQAGRQRVYEGSLSRAPSKPGDYVLSLRSEDGKKVYLSRGFKIVGAQESRIVELESYPTAVEDLSPRLPAEVRKKLLIKLLSDRLSYRVELEPPRKDRRLNATFWSYALRWNRATFQIDDSSIMPKKIGKLIFSPLKSD